MKRLISVVCLTIICALPAFSQDCAELKSLIGKTYGFKPSKLNAEQQTAKSAEMDVVWSKVKADQKNLVPCLKAEMEARKADGFFRFDAASLLINLDQSADYKNLLIKTHAEVDLDDINLSIWISRMAFLAYEGFDTTAAAEAWMKHPAPRYYLPQHGTRPVTKAIGATILYGSMDEAIATPALSKIASTEGHPGRELALMSLIQQATPESFAELRKLNRKGLPEPALQVVDMVLTKPRLLAKREGEPKNTRQQFIDAMKKLTDGKPSEFVALASAVPDGERDVITVMTHEDIPLIRKARRIMMLSANPHSQDWYDSFSKILMAMVWKSEAAGRAEAGDSQ